MKQNFANLGTRTPDRRQISAAPANLARKLLLILGAGADLPANRESTYNPPLSRGFFFSDSLNRGGTVLHPGGQIWGGAALGRSFRADYFCCRPRLNPDPPASGVLPLPLD